MTESPSVSDKSVRLEDIPFFRGIDLRLATKRMRNHWHAAEFFSVRRSSYALREPNYRQQNPVKARQNGTPALRLWDGILLGAFSL